MLQGNDAKSTRQFGMQYNYVHRLNRSHELINTLLPSYYFCTASYMYICMYFTCEFKRNPYLRVFLRNYERCKSIGDAII